MTTLSTFFILSVLPFVLSAFTQNTCWPGVGCIQKATNGKFCYYPVVPGTDASCSTQDPLFSGVMAAHLAQGHSIAYYGPDNVFVGDTTWPYPANPGIVFLCASGSLNGAYQSFCTQPTGDNSLNLNNGNCIVGLPMKHVDDGCYDPSLAIVNVTSTPSTTSTTSATSATLALPSVSGITQAPSPTADGNAMTVYNTVYNTVTVQSSSAKASSSATIVIIPVLILAYCVLKM